MNTSTPCRCEPAGTFAATSRKVMADVRLGAWLSAALDDPSVCAEMKADIQEWFAGSAFTAAPTIPALERDRCAQLALDQQSDEPAPGDWNGACQRIADAIRALEDACPWDATVGETK